MKSNIPENISTCIVSQQTEVSETRQRVINLGKSLIAEFDEQDSTDTLTKWLIHYVAEQLEIISNSKGQEKVTAEKKCVDVILTIWVNRSALPDGLRPFENFEPILRGLARLDNQSSRHYYNNFSQFDYDVDNGESSETMEWVDNAIKIDEGARTLVSESFKIAAEHAKDEKTREILNHTQDLSDNHLQLIIKLYGKDKKQASEEELLENRREELREKIISVNNMIQVCNQYSELIQKELNEID